MGGRPEPGYRAVGALVMDGEAFCSGTLVRPTVLVTAAHCLEGVTAGGTSVFFGSDASNLDAGELIQVAGVWAHPGYDDFELTDDIGVVTLSRAASPPPIDVQTSPMGSGWVGRDALFVGFGVTDAADEAMGGKHSVDVPITEVAATTFTYSAAGTSTCFGDSGGPALYAGTDGVMRLIGVTSWGDEACKTFGVNTRVDAYADFLQPFLDGQGAPSTGDGGADDGGSGGDWCAEEGYYGDGWCDGDCPSPDSDCGDGGSDGDSGDADEGEDWCADEGYYGDDWCDEDCPSPDPDCGASGPSEDGPEDSEPTDGEPGEVPEDGPWGGTGCSVGGGGAGSGWWWIIAMLAVVRLVGSRRSAA